jgi:hypothetical protein
MSATAIAGVVFACVFGGALLGMVLRTVLPEGHLSTETKDVVKVAIAMIATMAALVLSLLVSTAKSAYDTRGSELVQMSGDIVMLDRVLARYGPDARDARALQQHLIAAAVERIWPTNGARPVGPDPAASPFEMLYDKIDKLSPQNDSQRSLQAQALKMATDLGRARFLLFQQMGSSIPAPFLIVVVFWLGIIFASFGLFAPRNGTVIFVFLVCAMSVSGAIFLILELDRSFEGMMQVSGEPLRQALAHLGQ